MKIGMGGIMTVCFYFFIVYLSMLVSSLMRTTLIKAGKTEPLMRYLSFQRGHFETLNIKIL
jgi:hypothetical protein